MRSFIVVLALSLSSAAMANCTLTVTKKKLDAKGAFFANRTISAKVLEQLVAGGCTVNTKLMSTTELIALEVAASNKRIAKLKAGK